MRVAPVIRDIRELIGNTPLLEITHFPLPEGVRLYAKLEYLNPGGSVKDRTCLTLLEEAEQLVRHVRLITLAESLGAVESLISFPAKMTYASIPAARRAELGITDTLVRLSVGIENVEDLKADLLQALTG